MENINAEESWNSVLDYLANTFDFGETIEHNTLKSILLIKDPVLADYENIQEFLKARDVIQFEYMALIQKLKKDLLKEHKLCLWSLFGVGYYLLDPKTQVKTGFEQTIKDIKKAFRDGYSIMTNVRNFEDLEGQRKDSDLVARLSMIRSMTSKIIK